MALYFPLRLAAFSALFHRLSRSTLSCSTVTSFRRILRLIQIAASNWHDADDGMLMFQYPRNEVHVIRNFFDRRSLSLVIATIG